ncbi:MAG: aspartate carbamoyltransferase regulatory subunit [Caldisphaeraceae archaeon]|nr:aspartate carbamoyltransferase regulatory subunit [Caldisphaeraceae archaeon]
MDNGKELLVSKIANGTVIDHINASRSLIVLKILNIRGTEGFRIAIVMNAPSTRMGKKDIVKLENYYPKDEDVQKISLIAQDATINIIKDYKVIKKYKVEIPKKIKGLLRCNNPTCITRKPDEQVTSTFTLINREKIMYQCDYCGSILTENDIIKDLTGEMK